MKLDTNDSHSEVVRGEKSGKTGAGSEFERGYEKRGKDELNDDHYEQKDNEQNEQQAFHASQTRSRRRR